MAQFWPTTRPPAYPAFAAGIVTQAGTITNGSGVNLTVTFPASRFSQPPIITATAVSARLTTGIAIPTVTTSGATVRLDNWSGGTAPDGSRGIQWDAIQMTSGSGSG